MKKKIKLSIIITASVIGVLLIAVLSLSLIKIKPVKYFEDYSRIAVVTAASVEKGETEQSKKALDKAVKTTEFSVMHAILEGKFSYSPRLVKENGEIKYLSAEEISALAPSAGNRMLKFYYKSDSYETIKIDGQTIKYNCIAVEFAYGKGEIVNAICTPYLTYNINNQSDSDTEDERGMIGSVFYKTPQFKLRIYASSLYNTVGDILG